MGVAAPSAVGFQEDFGDGVANDWQVASGKWKVKDGAYVQEEGDPGVDNARNRASGYAVGDKKWLDYTFQVKVKPLVAGGYAGVMFRVTRLGAAADGNTFGAVSEYYYWLIGIGGTYSKIWQAPAGQALEEAPGDTLTMDKWSDLKVEMKGQRVRLFMNGKQQKDFTFPAAVRIESGGIALATYNAKAAFDDVEVSGDGIPSLAVGPAGRLPLAWAVLRRAR
jgi:hypothetical protein